ncbi:MAG: hypothetical protein JJE04_27105 [Acidobacteriia bacterium]|nr:hypothetical protein [Terriglobia bacterium]
MIAQPGTGPITDVSVLHGDFWPEEEDVEDFIAAYREWRGHKRAEPVTMIDVSPLDAIIEDLKLLPPEKLKIATDFVSRLNGTSEEDRQAALARTSGCLSQEEADELERVIEEGCEKIDEDGWRPLL